MVALPWPADLVISTGRGRCAFVALEKLKCTRTNNALERCPFASHLNLNRKYHIFAGADATLAFFQVLNVFHISQHHRGEQAVD